MQSETQNEIQTGEKTAVMYKYYRQFFTSGVYRPISKNRISATGLYNKHKAAFDRITEVFAKRGLNVEPYVKFYSDVLGRTENDIDENLASASTVALYSAHVAKLKKYKNIMEWFDKSVANLGNFCEAEHVDAIGGFRLLAKRKQLSSWYVCGKLSKYWLAAIPGFDKAVEKLDYFSKLEFSEIAEKYDVYNTEVNKAFLHYRNMKANPMKAVDKFVAKRRAGV